MKKNLWTNDEIQFLKENYLEISDKEMTKYLNRTELSIATKRKKLGLLLDNCQHKKYSFQDVIDEFAKTNYELLSDDSEYIDSAQPTLRYICPYHRDIGEQKISLSHLINGRGCYYCGREKTISARKIDLQSNKDFYKNFCESKGFIFVDIIRDNGKITIVFICPNHKELGEQKMPYHNMKRITKGCQYCSGKNLPDWYVIKKISEINPNIELLEKYTNLTTKIKCICKKHNRVTYTTAQDLLKCHGCYDCGIEKLSEETFVSFDEVQKRIYSKNPHVKLIEYRGASNLSKCYCTKHNMEFYKGVYSLYNNSSGCCECYSERMRETQGLGIEEFERRLKDVHPELKVVGEYINNSTPIELYCTKHDYYFSLTPVAILDRLSCCEKSRITYKEEVVCQILEKWGYKVERQKSFPECKDKRNLLFDIYLSDYNIAIEYQGEQHYRPVRYSSETYEDAEKRYLYTKSHDTIKEQYCKDNGIPLLQVPYWEFEDLEYYLFDSLVKLHAIEENSNIVQNQ